MIMIIINYGEKQKHKPWFKPDRTYHDTSTVSLCFTCLQRLQSLVRTDSCQSPGILDVQNRGHTFLGWNMAKPFELLQFEYNWNTQFHSILYMIFIDNQWICLIIRSQSSLQPKSASWGIPPISHRHPEIRAFRSPLKRTSGASAPALWAWWANGSAAPQAPGSPWNPWNCRGVPWPGRQANSIGCP